MKIASGWRFMSATPPRFDSSFSSSASSPMRSFAGRRSSWPSVFRRRSSCRCAMRSVIVRQFVSRPPSQRFATYGMPTRAASVRDGVLRLLLRADEEHRAAARGEVARKVVGLLEQLGGLGQVDDVDAAALGEDEALHLRIPAAGLVAEVDSGLQELTHGDDCQGSGPLSWLIGGAAGVARAEPMLRARHPRPFFLPGRRNWTRQSVAALRPCGAWTWPKRTCLGTVPGQVRKDGARRSRRARSSAAARSGGSGDSRLDPLAREGMVERERGGVQELPLEAEVAGDAVDGVAADRQLDRREVDADLVRPARLEPHVEQRARAEQLRDLEPRDRLARRRRVERVPRCGRCRSRPIGASIRPRPRPRRARDEREVAALDLAPADRLLQPACASSERATTSRPGGVAVEPVDDARPVVVSAGRVELEQPVHERPGRRPGARVDDETGRLVDDEQVLVLPGDVEVHRLRRELDRLGQLDDHVLPALEPVALGPPLAVDEHGAARDQPLGEPARADLGARGEHAVEPRPPQGRESGESPTRRGAAVAAVGARERGEQHRDADDDEGVREVERRPVAEVEEVRHVAEPDAVEQVRDAAADHEAERDRAAPDGARPSARRRRASRRRRSRSARSRSPSRSRRGRTRCRSCGRGGSRTAPRPAPPRRGRARARRPASSAGRRRAPPARSRARPSHCARAGAERALGGRDRAQRVRRRADADVEPRRRLAAGRLGQPRRASARRRCRASSTERASSRSCGISLPQTAQVPYVPASMRASASSISRSWLSRVLLEAVVELAVVASRVAVSARWLSLLEDYELPDLVVMVVPAELVMLDRRAQPLAALEQRAPGSGRCRCSSGLLSARRGEPSLDLRRREAGQLDDLVSRAAARNERHARARQRERLGEQREHGLVRAPALGRRGDAHLPGVAVAADDRRPRRAGRDAQPQPCGSRHASKDSGATRRAGEPRRDLARPGPPALRRPSPPRPPRAPSAAAP